MTDDPTEAPTAPFVAEATAGAAITTAATTAVSAMFEAVFAALTTELQHLVKDNGPPNPMAPALQMLTTDMVKTLNDRVKEALGGRGQ